MLLEICSNYGDWNTKFAYHDTAILYSLILPAFSQSFKLTQFFFSYKSPSDMDKKVIIDLTLHVKEGNISNKCIYQTYIVETKEGTRVIYVFFHKKF